MKVVYLKIAATLLMLAPASVLAGKSVDENWDLDEDAMVSIENIAGSIEIRGWNRNEAHLTGELGNSVEELEVSASDSSLQITVANRNERNIDNTNLVLMVPMGASIDASAVLSLIHI